MMGALLPGVKRHRMGRQLTGHIAGCIETINRACVRQLHTSPIPHLLVLG